MSIEYNIYCDESCHIENEKITEDNQYMVIGATLIPAYDKNKIFDRIKRIKESNGIKNSTELKWTKVGKSKIDAYIDLINYFFDNNEFSFRCVVINKKILDHKRFNNDHDDFYYKMYWQTLGWFVDPPSKYNIYLDIKDTQGVTKTKKLDEVLESSHGNGNYKSIKKIQEIRSHEVAVCQLTDILIGAISYENRYKGEGKSPQKRRLVNLIKDSSKVSLQKSTFLGARKFNIFHWEGR